MKYYWLYHDKLCSPVALLDVTGAVAVQLLPLLLLQGFVKDAFFSSHRPPLHL